MLKRLLLLVYSTPQAMVLSIVERPLGATTWGIICFRSLRPRLRRGSLKQTLILELQARIGAGG
jgi:hypothetical protein